MIYTILGVYFILMILITVLFTKKSKTKEGFLVGNRNTGSIIGGLSIAATWIWAPALLVSAEQGFKWGWYGLAMFLIPNILCLLFFIPYAKRIRRQYPDGTNLPSFMKKIHGKRTGKVYKSILLTVSVLSTAVQLLAGAMILTSMSGISFLAATILLSAIVFSYSLYSGIRASMITDGAQMIIMLLFSIILVLFTGHKFGLSQFNLSGATDFSKLGVFLSFGLSTTIGLISGPFGDQTFWQRAFSIDEKKLTKAFIIGAVTFVIVPLSMGLIGMASTGIEVANTGLVNMQFIQEMLPSMFNVLFIFIILSGLMSTLDSNLLAFASLVDAKDLKKSRLSMLVLLGLGILIANIPNLTVTKLFMIYGSIRSITLIPTILTLHKKKIKHVDKGMMLAVIVGLPIFAYGTLKGITTMIVVGSLLSVLLPGIIIYLGGKNGIIKIKRKRR